MKTRFEMRALAIAVALVVVVVAAAFACAARPQAVPVPFADLPGPPPSGGSAPVGPTGRDHGVPVGWRHDTTGAAAAACGFVESSQLAATAGPLARRDVVLALASPGYGPDLVEVTDRRLDDVAFSLAGRSVSPAGLVWSEHALSVDVAADGADRVVARVWSVLVVGVDGAAPARQVWRTSTLTLVWVGGDWKVDRWDSTPGPLPAPVAQADVSSVPAITVVTRWRSAVGVGS